MSKYALHWNNEYDNEYTPNNLFIGTSNYMFSINIENPQVLRLETVSLPKDEIAAVFDDYYNQPIQKFITVKFNPNCYAIGLYDEQHDRIITDKIYQIMMVDKHQSVFFQDELINKSYYHVAKEIFDRVRHTKWWHNNSIFQNIFINKPFTPLCKEGDAIFCDGIMNEGKFWTIIPQELIKKVEKHNILKDLRKKKKMMKK